MNNTIAKQCKKGFFCNTDIPFSTEKTNDEGQRHGKSVWFYQNGVKKRTAVFENDVMISSKWFYNDGVEKVPGSIATCITTASEGINPNSF